MQPAVWTLLILTYFCGSIHGQAGVPPPGSEYNDVNRDGSFRFGFQTGDAGAHYQAAVANQKNQVAGRFGSWDPAQRRVVDTEYTAGKRGFRARGPNIARKMDLSQTKIPYNPPVSPNSPNYNPTYDGYHDPNEDPSYSFTFRTPTYTKQEISDSRGHVNGAYYYYDDIGERHDVTYEAGSKIGFNVNTPFPDSKVFNGLFYKGPSKAGEKPRGKTSIQQRLDGSYRFVASGPDQRRTEISDSARNVRGSYTYVDDKGQQRTVEYIAGPNIGYRIVKKGIGPNFPAPPPFIPPPNFTDLPDRIVPTPATSGRPFGTGTGKPSRPDSPDDNGIGGQFTDNDNFPGFPSDNSGENSGGGNIVGGGGSSGGGNRPDFGSGGSSGRPGGGLPGDGGSGENQNGFGGGDQGFSRPGGDQGFSRPGGDQGFSRPGVDQGFSRPGGDQGFSRPGGGDQGFSRPGGDQGFSRPGGDNGFPRPGSTSGGSSGGGNIFAGGSESGENGSNDSGSFPQGGGKFPSGGTGSDESGYPPSSGEIPAWPTTAKPPVTSGKPPPFNHLFQPTFPNQGKNPQTYPSSPRPPTSTTIVTSSTTETPYPGYFSGKPKPGSPAFQYPNNCCGTPPSTGRPDIPGSAFPEDDPNRPHRPPPHGQPDAFLNEPFENIPPKGFESGYFKPSPTSPSRPNYYYPSSQQGDSTFLSSNKNYFSFPSGVAVRAHIQSLDILPFGSRIPPPGLALEQGVSSHSSG